MAALEAQVVAGGPEELADALTQCRTPMAVWSAADGRVLLLNRPLAALVGVDAASLVGRRVGDFWSGPPDAVERAIAALGSGEIDALRARRALHRSDGTQIPVYVWTRVATVGGRPGGVSLIVPLERVGVADLDGSSPWRHLAAVAVGVADREWRIEQISRDITAIAGVAAPDLVGRSLFEVVHLGSHPSHGGRLVPVPAPDATGISVAGRIEPSGASGVPPAGGSAAGGSAAGQSAAGGSAAGQATEVQLLYAPYGEPDHPDHILFALVGKVEAGAGTHASARVRELEARLRRIAVEVRAAGILDAVSALPPASALPGMHELTSRQWDIVSRIYMGERVPQIAAALYLSQSTVRNHLSAIFRRFGVHSQAELLARLRAGQGGGGQGGGGQGGGDTTQDGGDTTQGGGDTGYADDRGYAAGTGYAAADKGHAAGAGTAGPAGAPGSAGRGPFTAPRK